MASQKVPPGFNALVGGKATELAHLVDRAILPVFRRHSEGKPAFEGTGVLCRVDGVALFVSAAHVFDALHNGALLLLEGRE